MAVKDETRDGYAVAMVVPVRDGYAVVAEISDKDGYAVLVVVGGGTASEP